ncbi:AAA family ATPase [Corynebacterium anserum]|uniref:AAA family ATPase n=1 Tax=Corynebacterium anserum TaxID=2684406 RepID=A0A7G7YP73_9CORY|nr:AAA family ATPase [Corynebacterium anserum]MBC2681898.1 AAA family ATPase [Corynebacterium anserum]QNH96293.1 AAA family ATPase [Corynebacterium anserum]
MLQIHKLNVENFAGLREARLELKDSGVTVIYGPNEAGKSTLLKAFKLLVSDVKVNSAAKSVKENFPRDRDDHPQISAELSVGNYRVRIEKFYRPNSGKAVLDIFEPQQETIVGREAEERFRDILNAETDRTLLAALTIEQGKSLDDFAALQVSTLATVMANNNQGMEDSAFGEEASDNSYASSLFEAIQKEYARYWTATGQIKAKSDFRAKKDALEAAQQSLADAEKTYREAQDYIGKLDHLQREKASISEKLPEAREAVVVCEAELKTAETVAATLAQLEDKVATAQQRHALAENQWNTRKNLIEQLNQETHELEKHAVALKTAQEAQEVERQRAEDREKRIEELEKRSKAAHNLHRAVEAAYLRLQAAEAIVADQMVLEDFTVLEARKTDLERELVLNPATGAVMTELRRAIAQLDAAVQLRDAVATSVHIDGPVGEIVSDDTGEHYELGEEGTELSIASRREITMGDFIVTVTPTQDQADQDRAVQRAQDDVRALSEKLQLADGDSTALLAQAEDKADERQKIEEKLSELSIEMSSVVAGRTPDSIRQKLQGTYAEYVRADKEVTHMLEDYRAHGFSDSTLSEFHERLVAQDSALGKTDIGDQASSADDDCAGISTRNRDAEERAGSDSGTSDGGGQEFSGDIATLRCLIEMEPATDFSRMVRQSRLVADEADKNLRAESLRSGATSEVTKSFFKAQAAHSSAERTVAKYAASLASARQEQSDESLSCAVEEALQASEEAETELQKGREANAGVELDTACSNLKKAQGRVHNLEQRLRQIDMDQVANEAYLDGRSDAADRRDSAQAECERAESDYARIKAQAHAARLLSETVMKARADMQAQYEKPFKETFEKLAEVVYGPGVHFDLAEDFSVTKRVLRGIDLEPQQLSGGAREQMLILARLAVARLVGGGEAVPIFIDDALGFSDVHRIESMNNLLGHLGRTNQVIVLTCDVERFDGIPGARQLSIDSITTAE